jgi:hypothetical protein|tara:strand:- start:107 stop:694 length:588 start_codon:yes stop_codon:yes gene_type:complete
MKPSLKWTAISIGGLVAIAHIGVLGHLIRQPRRVVEIPTINIPRGTPYSSYKIEAGKEGYRIEYKANDPKLLESERSVDLVQTKNKKGFFGGSELFEDRNEYRRDQYTMEGVRNMGGASLPGEGKSAKDIECIVADAGARSQGAMAGSAITTGLVAPAVMNIPYIGWLAAGWATLFGNSAGETIGSQVGSMFNDC